jgi:competence protein ComGC
MKNRIFANQTVFKNKKGSFALYLIVFLMIGILLSLFFFFPQFLNMQSGIYSISCKEIRRKVEEAVAEHDANSSISIIKAGEPVDLDLLKEKGFLDEIQKCPQKGKFIFKANGKIICTVHKDENK